jgi:hypothetical protein
MTDISIHSFGKERRAPLSGRIAAFFAIFAAARNCAAALEVSRRPAAVDLRQLGIDPKAFVGIRLS